LEDVRTPRRDRGPLMMSSLTAKTARVTLPDKGYGRLLPLAYFGTVSDQEGRPALKVLGGEPRWLVTTSAKCHHCRLGAHAASACLAAIPAPVVV
jgi:hypothetical protein